MATTTWTVVYDAKAGDFEWLAADFLDDTFAFRCEHCAARVARVMEEDAT